MEDHGNFHGIYSWKLRLMEAMGASKVLPPTVETSMYFHGNKLHGGKSSSTNFHENFIVRKTASIDFHCFHWSNLFMWKLVETSMEVDRKAKYCGGPRVPGTIYFLIVFGGEVQWRKYVSNVSGTIARNVSEALHFTCIPTHQPTFCTTQGKSDLALRVSNEKLDNYIVGPKGCG